MELSALQQEVDRWIKEVGVRYFNELTNTAVLMEEVGEVARLMAYLYGEKSFKSPEQAASAHIARLPKRTSRWHRPGA